MTERVERELAVFSEARRLPVSQRDAFLNQACAGNAALRRHVQELLRAGDEAGSFLESPAAHPPGADAASRINPIPSEKPGDKIGRYKLLQQIGEGGCGVVYLAEQEEPVRRRVALKVIKLGMDTKNVIARFEAERQALALMDHPNIARVLDAGATDTGRPYFVMELVRGVKITDFCDQSNLPIRERLDLFVQVCRAIQHAHQKGIIHRDIKPSNILVTVNDGVPVPKVIDFGIAKATQGRLTDQTLFTAFEQFVGTPAYMSPEQAVMTSLDIDTRSDIYSLGVLLYELLTGKTPFDQQDLLAAGMDEMRRTIREKEPAKPSTRLTQELVAQAENAKRREAIETTVHFVRGDLDWIVMKALEKDRRRRYETANGFARDIERFLADEPVVARPQSRLYVFQKTVRRHKFGFATAGALLTVLAAGVVVSTHEAIRSQLAEHQAQVAEASERLLRQRMEYRLQIAEAASLFDKGQPEKALQKLDDIQPESAGPLKEQFEVRRLLLWEYAKENAWARAVSNSAAIVQMESLGWNTLSGEYYNYFAALVMTGDLTTYNQYRKDLVASRAFSEDGSDFVCLLTLLTPADQSFLQSLAPLAARASTRTNYGSKRVASVVANNRATLSLYAYRTGDYTNASRLAVDAFSRRAEDPTIAPWAHAVNAMALVKLGRESAAKEELEAAKTVLDPIFKTGVSKITDNEGRWWEWHVTQIFVNEAERVVNTPGLQE